MPYPPQHHICPRHLEILGCSIHVLISIKPSILSPSRPLSLETSLSRRRHRGPSTTGRQPWRVAVGRGGTSLGHGGADPPPGVEAQWPWPPAMAGRGAPCSSARDVVGSTVVNSSLVKSGRTLASAIAKVRKSFLPVNLPFACTFYPCPMPIFDVVPHCPVPLCVLLLMMFGLM